MNLFGKEPQEQAMQTLIHDTNQTASALRFRTKNISEWLTDNRHKLKEAGIDATQVYLSVEYLKTAEKQLKEIVDAYYKEFENDFKAKE